MRILRLFQSFSHKALLLTAVALGSIWIGSCSADTVSPSAVVVTMPEMIGGPLAGLTPAYLNGTYRGCQNHTDDSHWSAKVTGFSGTTSSPSPRLEVTLDDQNCTIYLTDVVMTNTSGSLAPITYHAAPSAAPIPDTDFSSLISFELIVSEQSSPDFVGNIRVIQPSAKKRFDANFEIDFQYRNDQQVSTNGQIVYVQVSDTSAAALAVNAPDYGNADFLSDTFIIGEDAHHKIVRLGGDLRLTANIQEGESWVFAPSGIVHLNGSVNVPGDVTSFADVKYSYQQAIASEVAISLHHPMLVRPDQLGFALNQIVANPVTRWMIVKHHDIATNLDTFETISIKFTPPNP